MIEPKMVGIVHEHDVLRRGIESWLNEDRLLSLSFAVAEDPPDNSVEAVVVSARALTAPSLTCPLVLIDDEPACTLGFRSPRVYATLPFTMVTPDQLLACVRAAAVGLRTEQPELRPAPRRLDERRLQILRLLASGETTRTISTTLCYSERTIKGLISDLEYELKAKSRAQAVAEAIRQGLI
ncbi:MAG TPA: LuxR C-terminal-related transcriptional regulator [Gaiellaceae bacterium]|nr:LuxR C-terminal-related transcriptional regulator [Gaiellaceae bacterium]